MDQNALNALRIARLTCPPEDEEMIISRAVTLEGRLSENILSKLPALLAERNGVDWCGGAAPQPGTVAEAKQVASHVLDGLWRETQTPEDALIDLIRAVIHLPETD